MAARTAVRGRADAPGLGGRAGSDGSASASRVVAVRDSVEIEVVM